MPLPLTLILAGGLLLLLALRLTMMGVFHCH